jgi:hypothetical protein
VRRAAAAASLLLAAVSGAQAAPARTHAYLRIDGVPGDSNDPSHLGWFDVASWTPAIPGANGRVTARLHIVGVPPADLTAVISGKRRLHEALLQDVQVGDGRLVRNVSFWQFVITGLEPARAPARSYAVILQATKVVCNDYGAPPADGGPCAVLKGHTGN